MSAQSKAIDKILHLMSEHDISLNDIKNASPQAFKIKEKSSLITTVFYYIGGIFIFSGLGVFISNFWDELGFFGQFFVTFGMGFLLYLMAILSIKNNQYLKLATPLFLISSLLQPTGIGLFLDHYSTDPDPARGVLFVSTFMLIQQLLTFYALRRAVLLFTSFVFLGFAVSSGIDLLPFIIEEWDIIGVILGIFYIGACAKLLTTPYRTITPFWFFIGSWLALVSLREIIEHSALEVLFLGAGAAIVYLSTMLSSRVLLLNGTIAILWYIGDFSHEYFADSLGWPIILVIMGVSCIGLGSYALKLNRKMQKTKV